MKNNFRKAILILFLLLNALQALAQGDITKKLKGFDKYMEQVLKDWNAPGVGVGIVVNGKLVFAKGYGYRDYEKKLPVTPNTLFQIASNTKLFTAIAAGFLVEEGKLEWDKPIRDFVPTIKFYNDELNNTITLHDMLSHRTGISRHDLIWYKSDFTREQLFSKLQYLEPSIPVRQGFLYNNLMYAAAGEIIELQSGKKWEDFIQEKILDPLQMKNTFFSAADMKKQPDYGVPNNEKRDSDAIYSIPLYEDTAGMGPAGSIISNINDLSHWLIALMTDGKYDGRQVIPAAILQATLQPSMPETNGNIAKGFTEILNPAYGMGRDMASYRGHNFTYHGGALPGFFSQISYMPQDQIGVIAFTIGDHTRPLQDVITYNVYERLLGLSLTPWSERRLKDKNASKAIGKEGRSKAGLDQVKGTKPSHPLADYTGEFENPAYGIIKIDGKAAALQFTLHRISMPLAHYHYDRFDTPNDQDDGQFSLNFMTNPQGDIGSLVVSVDEGEVTFTRKAGSELSNPEVLAIYAGSYKFGETTFEILLKANTLFVAFPGAPPMEIIPTKPGIFRIKDFSDSVLEFVTENGIVTGLKQKDPSGEYLAKRI